MTITRHSLVPWRVLLAVVLLAAIRARGVRAADPPSADWTLTTADFRAERVNLKSIDSAGAHVTAAADGAARTVGFDQLLQLDRNAAARATPSRLVLCLTGGDRIGGEPVAVQGENLRWRSSAFGEITSPLRRVAAIVRPGVPTTFTNPSGDPQTEDVIQLGNGDTVRGIVADVTPAAVTIQPSSGGDAQAVPFDSILAAYFASTSAAATTGPAGNQSARGFRVKLGDESIFTGRDVATQGGKLRLTLADDTTREIALSSVASIEQVNGPVVWLPSLAPAENVQTPYFGQQTQPAQMDRSLGGEPIKVGTRTFAHGIGVHAYSKLSFPITDDATRTNGAFRTQYAIDGSQPWADVTVRIKLDDKVAYEKPNVKSGPPSPVVVLPLGGARTITLEVDYGENYDVQDRFVWLEPALLREKPAPAPAPAPALAPSTAPSTQP